MEVLEIGLHETPYLHDVVLRRLLIRAYFETTKLPEKKLRLFNLSIANEKRDFEQVRTQKSLFAMKENSLETRASVYEPSGSRKNSEVEQARDSQKSSSEAVAKVNAVPSHTLQERMEAEAESNQNQSPE